MSGAKLRIVAPCIHFFVHVINSNYLTEIWCEKVEAGAFKNAWPMIVVTYRSSTMRIFWIKKILFSFFITNFQWLNQMLQFRMIACKHGKYMILFRNKSIEWAHFELSSYALVMNIPINHKRYNIALRQQRIYNSLGIRFNDILRVDTFGAIKRSSNIKH